MQEDERGSMMKWCIDCRESCLLCHIHVYFVVAKSKKEANRSTIMPLEANITLDQNASDPGVVVICVMLQFC